MCVRLRLLDGQMTWTTTRCPSLRFRSLRPCTAKKRLPLTLGSLPFALIDSFVHTIPQTATAAEGSVLKGCEERALFSGEASRIGTYFKFVFFDSMVGLCAQHSTSGRIVLPSLCESAYQESLRYRETRKISFKRTHGCVF